MAAALCRLKRLDSRLTAGVQSLPNRVAGVEEETEGVGAAESCKANTGFPSAQ
jgi:hypothetical protein